MSEFFNRELSWIEFNRRVLWQGIDSSNPPLERLKFLSIVSSNFDEFFMVRVATVRRQMRKGDHIHCPSGMAPSAQLDEIENRVRDITTKQYDCFNNVVLKDLAEKGLIYRGTDNYSESQTLFIKDLFNRDIFHTLTPVRIEKGREFPFTNSLRLHVLFELSPVKKENGPPNPYYTLVQIPPSLERIWWLPAEERNSCFTLVEDIIVSNGAKLFPGYTIKEYCLFRVTRDADLSVDEERDEDYLEAMEEVIVNRQYSYPVRLEISGHSPKLKELLLSRLSLDPSCVYLIKGPLDLKGIMSLSFVKGFDHLRFEDWKPQLSPAIQEDMTIWENLKRQDILLHHPYESFDTVIDLINKAADDPEVIAIKMTLYRTSGDSPIIKALGKAAKNGKQVTAVVELKARFDEERNINWAYQLERAGVIVVYGIAHLKIHSKATLIIRREPEGVRRYVHLGTGNYNDSTAKIYTDFGFLTAKDDITFETVLFFNAITGYSSIPNLQKIVMSPSNLKTRLLSLIEREIEKNLPDAPGRIMAKINSLADPDIIEALYRASNAGIQITLNVRGICMLVPGVSGLSSNITVVSIIDRYLEHSRIFYFHNGGQTEMFLSSADWMPRNLERRVELMFPIENQNLKQRLVKSLNVYFSDNVKASILQRDGSYKRRTQEKGRKRVRAQEYFHEKAVENAKVSAVSPKKEFIVRRTPHFP